MTHSRSTTAKRTTVYLTEEDLAAVDAVRNHLRTTGKAPWANQMAAIRSAIREGARVLTRGEALSLLHKPGVHAR